jgi:two-component system response regulator
MNYGAEILLVEDNPNDVELTLRALKKRNILADVFVVNDGAEALDFLFKRGAFEKRSNDSMPRLVLLDMKLPKVDGLDVLRAIKTDEKTRNIPVVVLSSSHEDRDIATSYQLGVNSYIVKPVDFTKFIDAVAELGRYWLSLNKPPCIG